MYPVRPSIHTSSRYLPPCLSISQLVLRADGSWAKLQEQNREARKCRNLQRGRGYTHRHSLHLGGRKAARRGGPVEGDCGSGRIMMASSPTVQWWMKPVCIKGNKVYSLFRKLVPFFWSLDHILFLLGIRLLFPKFLWVSVDSMGKNPFSINCSGL